MEKIGTMESYKRHIFFSLISIVYFIQQPSKTYQVPDMELCLNTPGKKYEVLQKKMNASLLGNAGVQKDYNSTEKRLKC